MNIDSRFPTKLNTIQEAPDAFLGALMDEFPSPKTVHLLIHAPPFSKEGESAPATLLAVGEEGWLLVSKDEGGSLSIDKRLFSDTLFVELTSILLWGKLRIDYSSVGTSYSAVVWFDTVGEELYRKAIDLILGGIERGARGVPAATEGKENSEATATLEGWPLHFCNEARRYRPWGQRLLGAAQWPAVLAGFRRELAVAGALLVTERELVLMADEKTTAWYPGKDSSKFGGIITYFPLVRLADYHVGHQGLFRALELEMHAGHGGEKLEILFPSDHEEAIVKIMEQARAAITGWERAYSASR
jgi:hypothetical protein